MSRVTIKSVFGNSDMSDTNQALQLQEMNRGLKFRITKEEGLY